MGRALRHGGVLAAPAGGTAGSPGVTPRTIRGIEDYVQENGRAGDFDIVREGRTPGDDAETAASTVRPFAEAGATW